MAFTRYPINSKTLILGNNTAADIPAHGAMNIEKDGELYSISVLAGTYLAFNDIVALEMDDADYANLSVAKYGIDTAFFLK